MKNLKRLTATLTAVLLAVSMAGCGGKEEGGESTSQSGQAQSQTVQGSSGSGTEGTETGGLDWLNTSGELPIVREGTEKTLKIAINMDVDSGNPEDMWFYHFIEKEMNIQLEVTKFTNENKDEFISLAFADNDLPDIIINSSSYLLSTDELVRYGSLEGQLLDLAPYINEELTPNLYALYQEHPEYKTLVTDSEGHVWSLGYVNDPADRGQISRAFLNYDWLEEEKLKVPATLDEFLNVLRKFKERGDNIIPIGGSYNSNNPCMYILNAFGYNTTDAKGLTVALRDGKVVLPVADREAYGEYLTTMNTIYKEGLIHPDFFTMDSTTANAVISEDRTGFLAQAPFVFTTNFSQWWGALPLISEYNSEAFWPVSSSAVTAGSFVVSANCENPELAMAFADWFFKSDASNYYYAVNGPKATDTDLLYGEVRGYVEDEAGNIAKFLDVEENPDLYPTKNDFLKKKVQLFGFKALGVGKSDGYADEPSTAGLEDPSVLRTHEAILNNGGEMHFRVAMQETLCKYTVTEGFPSYVYLDAATQEQATNLLTVIKEYAEQETAKFITGARSLDELNAYFDEIERLGALEYVKIYQDYYDSIQ